MPVNPQSVKPVGPGSTKLHTLVPSLNNFPYADLGFERTTTLKGANQWPVSVEVSNVAYRSLDESNCLPLDNVPT